MTESLLGETERRDEVVVLGLSRRWKEEEDSFRLSERSRVMLVLRRAPPGLLASRPRGLLVPPGGERRLFLLPGFKGLVLLVLDGAEVGASVRGIEEPEGRGWEMIGRGCVAETLTVFTLMSCFVMAAVPAG